MDQTIQDIIARFRRSLEHAGVAVDGIVLFGSYSRNEQREGSDIDLAVISPTFRGLDFWQRGKYITKAVYEVFEPIEALGYTPEEWAQADSIICEIAKETGTVIPA